MARRFTAYALLAALAADRVGARRVSMKAIRSALEDTKPKDEEKEVSTSGAGAQVGKECFADKECCAAKGDVTAEECGFFCKEGTEIVTGSASGWKVRGACQSKWVGFCKEDDDCTSFEICDRSNTSLEGTCIKDTACAEISCGRGSCRQGSCTCEFGVTGEHCDTTSEAFAFLYYGDSVENLVSTRVLLQSLRNGGALQDFVAIIPENMKDTVPEKHLNILKADGVKPYFSEPIPMPISMDKDLIIHKRWSGVMNKFIVWRMTQYTQVALLDTDMVFSFDSQNPMEIFSECTANLCAVRDGDPRFMNAGVIVITPSEQRLEHILHVLKKEQHHFAMPEQSFLTEYCKKPENRMTLQYMDKKWNSCVGGGMMHNVGWESSGYNVLHSCSWTEKPPEMQMCVKPDCDEEGQWHTVLQWQYFHKQADPCIEKTSETMCGNRGIGMCHWCGHYCGRSDIECSKALFKKAKEADPDEPTHEIYEQVYGDRDHAADPWPHTDFTETVDKLPRGSWAWPQVAMYQILIDRFAMENPQPCEKLDDYCGGSLAGIRSKLSYLKELGVDGVLMSPVVEQMPHAYHGYHAKDLYKVNPQYGTEEELHDLVMRMHMNDMKVIIDVNLNNAGMIDSNNPEEVAQVNPFNRVTDYHANNCSLMHNEDYERGAYFLERCKLYGLADYDHENPRVRELLQKWIRDHVDKYGFDGIRVDAARHMPKEFLESIPEKGAPFPAFFEVVNGDMNYVASYASGEYASVYNYPLYFLLKDIFVPIAYEEQKPMSDLADYMEKEASKVQNHLSLNFLENNDLPRFIYKVDGDMMLYHNALLCMLGMEGLPVLLFGGEQNSMGVYDPLDKLKVDNWRPPTWHDGYNTTNPTFKLIQKVLWVRQRLNGMHHLKQHAVYSDQKVVIFNRGPVIFAVTNVGEQGSNREQRMVWDNATEEGHEFAYSQPRWVCNLLAEDPESDCGIIAPRNASRLHLNGEPKMYVPYPFVTEYQEFAKHLAQAETEAQASGNTHIVAPFAKWDQVEGVEVVYETQRRHRRSRVASDVKMTHDDGKDAAGVFPKSLPPHMDLWSPPVGVPVSTINMVTMKDACFFSKNDASENPTFVLHRGEDTYLLQESAEPDVASLVASVTPEQISLPVLLLEQNLVSGGYYHRLVNGMPVIANHLTQLRNREMRWFHPMWFHPMDDATPKDVYEPVFSLLGVPADTAVQPTAGQTAVSFCAPEMLMSQRPKVDANELTDVSRWQLLRRSITASLNGAAPAGAEEKLIGQRRITLLAGSLHNEEDVANALKAFGDVQVLLASPSTLRQTVEALQNTDILVGVHGSSLADMVYARDGVKVVEIVPYTEDNVNNGHFRQLAGQLGFPYLAVNAGAQASSDSDGPSVTTSVEKLTGAIKEFLAYTA